MMEKLLDTSTLLAKWVEQHLAPDGKLMLSGHWVSMMGILLEKTLMLERLKVGGEGNDRG